MAYISVANHYQNSPAAGTTGTCTATNAQTLGNTNLVAVMPGDGTVTVNSVTDVSGNTYLLGVQNNQGGASAARCYLFYSIGIKAATAGSNIVTCHYSGTPGGGNTFAIWVVEFAGITRAGLASSDQGIGSSSGTVTSMTTAAITTSYINAVIFGIFACGSSFSAAGTGYTELDSPDPTEGCGVEYQIFTSIVTNTPTASQSPGSAYTAAAMAFYGSDAGWAPVDVEPRGRGRIFVPEDLVVKRLTTVSITDVASYAPVEVDPRGKGRPIAEPEPAIEARQTGIHESVGFVPVDVEPRGKGRAPLTEDLPLAGTTKSIGFADVDVNVRGKGRLPLEISEGSSQPIPFTDVASFTPVEVDPRGKGRAILTEDFLGTRITPLALDDIASWAPVEVDPRGKGRAPLVEDPPVEARQTGVSESVGWVQVEADPRGKGRFPLPEDAPTEDFLLRPIGWLPVDVEPRGKGRAIIPEDPPVEPRIPSFGSVGWVDVEISPRGKGRGVVPEDPPVQSLHTLSSVGFAPVDVEPRGRGRVPVPEDPLVEPVHIVNLLTGGWMPVDVEPRGKGRFPLPEDPPVEARQVSISSIGWVDVDLVPRKHYGPLLDVDLPPASGAKVFPPVLPPPPPPVQASGGLWGHGTIAVLDASWGPPWPVAPPPPRAEQYDEELDPDDERAEQEEGETSRLIESLQSRAGWPTSGTAQPDGSETTPAKTPAKTTAQPEETEAQLFFPKAQPQAPPAKTPPKTLGAPATPTSGAWTLGLLAAGTAAGLAAWLWEESRREQNRRLPPGNRAEAPERSTVTSKMIWCGNKRCRKCAASSSPPHGPYWYAYWEDERGHTRWRYLGRKKPTR